MSKINVSVSLVLGSGGARGHAHIGVIRALEERGIRVGNIAGTSMGYHPFIACLLEGEKMAPLCREFGISRVTGYKNLQPLRGLRARCPQGSQPAARSTRRPGC